MTRRIIAIATIRDAKLESQRSKSRQPKGLLVVATKREEKEDDDQHEDHNQKGCEQLQTQNMQDLDHNN
jgi:hypothetical protein